MIAFLVQVGGIVFAVFAWFLVLAIIDQVSVRRMKREFRKKFPEGCWECSFARHTQTFPPPHDCRAEAEKQDLVAVIGPDGKEPAPWQ